MEQFGDGSKVEKMHFGAITVPLRTGMTMIGTALEAFILIAAGLRWNIFLISSL